MLKVILADDEKKIILLLQKLIDWDKLGYEIVGIANDGLSALKLVEEHKPQLLITDIRMPGCDGIELLRMARLSQPDIHLIVISGYQEFEYAQSALKYGVEDYLLKPLKRDELTNILLRLREKLGVEAEIEYRRKKDKEKMQELFLSQLKLCTEKNQRFMSCETSNLDFGFSFKDGTYTAAIVKTDVPNARNQEESCNILAKHSLEIIRKEIGAIADEYAAAVITEGVLVVWSVKEYIGSDVMQCFTKIRRGIEKQRELFRNMYVSVCLGSRKNTMIELPVSLQEALWLCKDRLCRRQNWRDAETEQIHLEQRYTMDPATKKRLQEAAEYKNTEQLKEIMQSSYKHLTNDRKVSGQMVEDWFYSVLRACSMIEQTKKQEDLLWEKLKREYWMCVSTEEIYQLLFNTLNDRITILKKEKEEQDSRPIAEAKRYIQDHFHETLKLEDVSNVVGFNATYFSTLFKKETGKNFSDYITEIRINRAKELLCREDVSISDAAEMVGYKDLKYFSRLFKKSTGINPSDYKKLYR